MTNDRVDIEELVRRAASGDREALDTIFRAHREKLQRMVSFRLDRRLQGRIDPSDVIQDAFLEAAQRLPEYSRSQTMPLFLWLRFLVAERLTTLHRHHLTVKQREAGREVSLYQGSVPAVSSAALAAQLVGNLTSPSEAAIRNERALKLQEALNSMDPIDREVLSLRHFEHLSRGEAARELGIREAAAAKRYIRALQRLKHVLAELDD